ncbi:MAG: T9SS type A sorting domain-containing protein [Sphingobacteriia bacterium]
MDSGAPIGDTSVFIYSGGWSGVTLTLNPGNRDVITISNVSAGATGFHVYRVNSNPNYQAGLPGGSIRNGIYWGVFPVGATPGTISYSATIDYTTNANLSPSNEPNLNMFSRGGNDGTSWSAIGATLTMARNTIALTSSGRGEFLLDEVVVLPIENLRLSAGIGKGGQSVNLSWFTDTEENTERFELQRSTDGVEYQPIHSQPAAGYSSTQLQYSHVDASPVPDRLFYRVKAYDLDGRTSYSNIASVKLGDVDQITVFPSPVQSVLYVNAQLAQPTPASIRLVNALGQVVVEKNATLTPGELFSLNTDQLRAGFYHLQVQSLRGDALYAQKVVKY